MVDEPDQRSEECHPHDAPPTAGRAANTVAELELDFVGGNGQSLLYEPEDSLAERASLSIAPRGLAEVTGEDFGISGVAA